MWEAVQHVSTPIGLFAFIAAVIGCIFFYYSKHRADLNDSLPSEKRWDLLNKEIEGYNLTRDNLTREQKFSLMKDVISEKSEHRKRQAPLITAIATLIIISITIVSVVFYKSDVKKQKYANSYVATLFGVNDNNQPRANIVDAVKNISTLNESFEKSRSTITIVTELGNTWILGSNYQSFKSALDRNVKINVFLTDFSNPEMSKIARYSTQKGEGKQGYTSDELIRGLEAYAKLAKNNSNLSIYYYDDYPWVRFTIFDDSAVSFVLRPMLNISKPQPMYSTDPVIIKMFEGVLNKIHKSSQTLNHVDEIEKFIERVKAAKAQN